MKKKHIIGLVLIATSIGIILSSLADSSTYSDFTTAFSEPGKEFHVVGKLNKEKPMVFNPRENTNLFSFTMADQKGIEREVVYQGTKPNDFEKSEQIVIIGKADGNHFEASGILMKCPSKYANSPDGEWREAGK